jgi:hypothetical protein
MGVFRLEVDVFNLYSGSLLVWLGLICASSASAKVNCSYLNEYQNKSPDLRIQNYLNFYAKKGLGAPLKIKVPGCIAAESESALRERYARAHAEHREDVKALKAENRKEVWAARLSKESTVKDAKAKISEKPELKFDFDPKLKTPSNLALGDGENASYQVTTFEQVKPEKKNSGSAPEVEGAEKKDKNNIAAKTPTKYDRGTATFCKALAVCELDDDVITVSNVFCRGQAPDQCPSATDCYQDSKVALDKVNLKMETNLKFQDGVQDLEGEQSPSSATQGR